MGLPNLEHVIVYLQNGLQSVERSIGQSGDYFNSLTQNQQFAISVGSLLAIMAFFPTAGYIGSRRERILIRKAINNNQPPSTDGQLYFPFMKDYV